MGLEFLETEALQGEITCF